MSERISWRRKVPWLRLIGLMLLGLLLWRLDIATLALIIRDANGHLLVIAAVLNLPMVLCKSLRWQALMLPQRIRYPVSKAYLAYLGSIFIGFLTPGRLGELVRAVHVSQDCRVSTALAFSSVLIDRLFDLYALLLIGSLALLSLTITGVENSVLALMGTVLLLTMPLAMLLNERIFARIRKFGLRLGRLGVKLFAREEGWLLEMRNGVRQLTLSWLVGGMGLTAVAYSVFFSQCYLLALALDLPVNVTHVSYAVALGSLVTLLPVSISGLGTREAAIVAYLGAVGVQAEAALGFSLLVFVTFYVVGGVMGAIAWWAKPVPLGTRGLPFREKL